jgi:hypothetical protein
MGLELILILIVDIFIFVFVFAFIFMHSTYNQVHSTAQHSREGEERGLGAVIGRYDIPVTRSGLAQPWVSEALDDQRPTAIPGANRCPISNLPHGAVHRASPVTLLYIPFPPPLPLPLPHLQQHHLPSTRESTSNSTPPSSVGHLLRPTVTVTDDDDDINDSENATPSPERTHPPPKTTNAAK